MKQMTSTFVLAHNFWIWAIAPCLHSQIMIYCKDYIYIFKNIQNIQIQMSKPASSCPASSEENEQKYPPITSRFSRLSVGSCSHTQIKSDSSTKQNHINDKNIPKHSFLKKNSREYLASSRSSMNQKNKQRNSKCSHPHTNTESISTNKTLNKMSSQKNPKLAPSKLPKKKSQNFSSNQSVRDNCRTLKTESMHENEDHNFYKAIAENGILCPPTSFESTQIAGGSINKSRSKIQSFSRFARNDRKPIEYTKNKLLNDENRNTLNTQNFNDIFTPNIQKQKGKICMSFLSKQQIQVCPQLYHLYRAQHLISQVYSQMITVRTYSKGRKQIKYQNGIIEVLYNNGGIKLTRWPNGDFKLKDENKISYWNEELAELDQYFID